MTAKEAVCRALKAQDVEYVFGNPGTTEVPFLDALASFPSIHYILALHESVAVGMADGYARASGRPGVANVHVTGGVANSMGMLFDACRDGTPLVLLAGQQYAQSLLREPMLSGDLVQMTQQFTKWSYQVNRGADVPLAMARAFKTCMQPPTGPVFLALPRDVLEEEVEAEQHEACSTGPGPAYRARGDRNDIDRAAQLLSEAHSPVVLVGPAVFASGAIEELTSLAEACALRVYATPGLLPWDYPLLCGPWRPLRQGLKAPLQEADLLMMVGSPLFKEFPPVDTNLNMPVIHLDPSPWEVGKNYPSCAGIVADLKAGLEDLLGAVKSKTTGEARQKAIRERRQAIEAANRTARDIRASELQARWDSVPTSAARLVGELGQVLDPSALIVDEAIRSSTYIENYYPFRVAGSYLTSEAGCLGWGFGAALGAKLAQPNRQVVAFLGDGSACFSMQALWTAARYQIALPIIICRNGAYMAVKSALSLYGGECSEQSNYYCAELGGIDFVGLAGSLGVEGRRVERAQDLRPSLEWSLAQ
ncbi:MAG: thiamine pyrophosphate-binding protein, partial [Dehalococcoidia bacterium]|nr:thiamine pyrophosphate-binding protein [Dehalococcoidia bacterium]